MDSTWFVPLGPDNTNDVSALVYWNGLIGVVSNGDYRLIQPILKWEDPNETCGAYGWGPYIKAAPIVVSFTFALTGALTACPGGGCSTTDVEEFISVAEATEEIAVAAASAVIALLPTKDQPQANADLVAAENTFNDAIAALLAAASAANDFCEDNFQSLGTDIENASIRSMSRVPEFAFGIVYDCSAWSRRRERSGRGMCGGGEPAG
jgi:hypothetical protein